MLTEIMCKGCGRTHATNPKKQQTIGYIIEFTGFQFIWDQSSGLRSVWLCPTCTVIVRDAWKKIVEIAGGVEELNMTGFLKRTNTRL